MWPGLLGRQGVVAGTLLLLLAGCALAPETAVPPPPPVATPAMLPTAVPPTATMPATSASTATAVLTQTPTAPQPSARHVTAVNPVTIYSGPASDFAPVGVLATGAVARVAGESQDNWIPIECPDGRAGSCWVLWHYNNLYSYEGPPLSLRIPDPASLKIEVTNTAVSPDGRWQTEITRSESVDLTGNWLPFFYVEFRVTSLDDGTTWIPVSEWHSAGLGEEGPPRLFHWSRDGRYLYYTSTHDYHGACAVYDNIGETFARLDLNHGLVAPLPPPQARGILTYSSDEKLMAYLSGQTVVVREVATAFDEASQESVKWQIPLALLWNAQISEVVWSADNQKVLIAADHRFEGCEIAGHSSWELDVETGILTAINAFVPTPELAIPTANSCYPSPFALTAWWPGNDGADDVIGEREGVLHGDATTGPGLVGQAFVLDGDGDYVDVPRNRTLNMGTGDFTIALWVRFNDTAGEQVLVEKRVQRFPGSRGWTLTKLENSVLRLAMGADFNLDSAPLPIAPDTWIHFAAAREAGAVTLFMNGQPVVSGRYAGSVNATSSLKLGHRGSPDDTPGAEDTRGLYLNGRLDELLLLAGRALPESFIRAIYDAGSLGQCPVSDAIPDLPNLAPGAAVSASAFLPEAPPQNGVNNQESGWNSGDFAPQWIEIDLQKPATITLIRMIAEQYPAGETGHQIWGGGPGEQLRLLHHFGGYTDTGQVLGFWPDPPLANIQTIRILTTESPSWVSWEKIEIYGTFIEPAAERTKPRPAPPVTPLAAGAAATSQTVQLLYPQLAGAFIELQVQPFRPELWTRMQWQDAHRSWHDIDGWQGSFNPDRRVLWYVGPDHLDAGPFRWLVYERQAGELLAVSQPFDLPSGGGELLQVTVTLPEVAAAAASGELATVPPPPAHLVVYETGFDALSPGLTQPFPGRGGQDGWYRELAHAPGFGEIQSAIALAGQALHEHTASDVAGLYQTIDKRLLTPPDLLRNPLITLEVSFYARISDLSARNAFDAFMSVNGGPHPGYEIAGFAVTGGNSVARGESGVNIALNGFNGADNNVPILPAVGQGLAWEQWHHVVLVIDHGRDRYVSLTVNGRSADLSAYALPRSELDGVWRRGQLMEEILANIAPHVEFGDRSEDDIYWDNVRILVGPADR